MPSLVVNGKKKKYEKAVSGTELAKELNLEGKALAMKVNGELKDLSATINQDAEMQVLAFDDPDGKAVFWHTTAHIFAYAIQELYPQALKTIGPSIETGFYYDFDNLAITPEDFKKIEQKMHGIAEQKLVCERKDLTLAEAKKLFKNNPYKIELAEEFAKENKKLTAYAMGKDFIDLCKGPHTPHTGYVKAMKLLSISTAHWRGDPKNKQLTRIYGTAFPNKDQLKKYLEWMREVEARDHRKLGKELDLFSFSDLAPGMPFFHPKGTIIFNTLLNFVREQYHKRGYQEVITPQVFHKKLWETSGHWEHYKDNMFLTDLDGQTFGLKPMNCPSHLLMYKTASRSYRDLPLRLADFGMLHRNERSGVFSGLLRVRRLIQDDAHIFCTPEQIVQEIIGVIDFVQYLYNTVFGFTYSVELSTKPEKALGDPSIWEQAEAALQSALKKKNVQFTIKPAEGAFYGPKIDFHIKDALGRNWQCATIQLDFNLPRRFDAVFVDKDNTQKQVIMIHRAILGSLERFIGILTEHYAGKFPLWLSPVQARVLPVSDKFVDYARTIHEQFTNAGIRAELGDGDETLNKKIRKAELDKINYIIVVGAKEQDNKTINVRTRDNVVEGEKPVKEFIQRVQKEIQEQK